MNYHKNARLTVRSREQLTKRVNGVAEFDIYIKNKREFIPNFNDR